MFSISTMEELGEVLSSRNHFRENLHTALLSLMGAVPVARGAMLLYDRRGGALELAAVRGAEASPKLRIELPKSTARTLWRRRRPLAIDDPPSGLASWLRRSTELREL